MSKARQALTYAAWTVLIVLGVATGIAVHRLWDFRNGLERLADRLTLDVGPESTLLYDANNNLVSALFEEHRIAVRLEEMSPHLVNAVLITEDRRFFDHDGIDLRRIVMAAVANQRAGAIVQGGSTITQQLVRSILLSREKNYTRKIKEAILARRLEERYAKRAILESYLNRVYFGDGYYGVEAAAIGYFGKSATDLDAIEAATLAGLIKGPSLYSPTKAPELARRRRNLVLNEMRAAGMLSDQDFQSAAAVPVKTTIARGEKSVPDPRHMRGAEYFRDTVQKELLLRFGTEAVYTGGLRVYTTLDRRLQAIAEESVSNRLKRMPQARSGGEPLQGALVAIEPHTGFVKAIVGGRDFAESPFNRAIDAKRQPGSAFKPFIYAQALESGFSPSSQLENLDQPIHTQQGPWLPGGDHEVSSVRLREGLVLSSNRAAAHLLQQVGVRRTMDLVSRFGINSPMPNVPSLALGTGEMSLFELTSAYGVFANRGIWRMPTTIRRVVDRYGREIYRAPDTERAVISEATAYLMTSMMADVVNRGTATSARATGFTLQAAGKTGTSNDYTDAWFVGYTPQLVTGVWFGYDTPQMIMNRGFAGVVAVPAWARFMMAATKGTKDDWFEMPGSLVKVKLCRISGLLATDRCHMPVFEAAAYDPNSLDVIQASAPIVKDGGVFDELRNIGRVPEPCPLLHGESDPLHSHVARYESAPMPLPAPLPPTSAGTAGASVVIYSPSATPVQPPASMTQSTRTPVMTMTPTGATVPAAAVPVPVSMPPSSPPPPPPVEPSENPVVPGTKMVKPAEDPAPARPQGFPGEISRVPPTPPRPPGNRSPGD
jgi:penicillin-binding protein 1A